MALVVLDLWIITFSVDVWTTILRFREHDILNLKLNGLHPISVHCCMSSKNWSFDLLRNATLDLNELTQFSWWFVEIRIWKGLAICYSITHAIFFFIVILKTAAIFENGIWDYAWLYNFYAVSKSVCFFIWSEVKIQ